MQEEPVRKSVLAACLIVLLGLPSIQLPDLALAPSHSDAKMQLADVGATGIAIKRPVFAGTCKSCPWENGYCESFNSKLRDEFLNGEIFYSMKELRVLAERWRVHYTTISPHSSLSYRSPAPEAWLNKQHGHGKVETATRFLLLHTPNGGYQNSEIAA